jgi:hypothetical protein
MSDPFMTSLSLGWFLLAAGVISAFVIATYKTSHAFDGSFQTGKLSGQTQDLKPARRWSLVALSILLAAYGALLIQQDHNWLPFQDPQSYASEFNTRQLRTGPGDFRYAAMAHTKLPPAASRLLNL